MTVHGHCGLVDADSRACRQQGWNLYGRTPSSAASGHMLPQGRSIRQQ